MSAELKPHHHLSARAHAHIQGTDWQHLRQDVAACDHSVSAVGGVALVDLLNWKASREIFRVPVCPSCAVLLDAALEGRLPERKDASHGE